MEVDTRVRYIRIDNEENKASGFYPPVGTLGTVKKFINLIFLLNGIMALRVMATGGLNQKVLKRFNVH